MSILETIQRAETEAKDIKRDAAQKAQSIIRDARQKADEAKAARVKTALEDAEKKLLAADERAKTEASALRQLRASEHEADIASARSRLPEATADILKRIVKAV